MAPSPSAVVTAAAHNPVVEEIPGLIRLYKDGHVERLPAVPEVPPSLLAVSGVASADVDINPSAGLWARIYSPTHPQPPLPVIVYFHGGGFCVGSAAWRCYHDFLSRLAVSAASVVVSVNYRLAPENRLPAAYDDGLAAVKWLQQPPAVGVSGIGSLGSWRLRCSFDSVFLAGDSAGGAIAYNVALRLSSVRQAGVRGLIMIQPFTGGEARTAAERCSAQSAASRSALSAATAECYWRMALPAGCGRDHPWCNPLGKGSPEMDKTELPPAMICAAELDILKERNTELYRGLRRGGKKVEYVSYGGVGHGFQILNNYRLSQIRTVDLLEDIKHFINKYK